MGRFIRSGRFWYLVILLIAFVVLLVRVLSPSSANVKELNSQQFLAAAHNHEIATNPSDPNDELTVHDGNNAVTGELKGGQQFVYDYPHDHWHTPRQRPHSSREPYTADQAGA